MMRPERFDCAQRIPVWVPVWVLSEHESIEPDVPGMLGTAPRTWQSDQQKVAARATFSPYVHTLAKPGAETVSDISMSDDKFIFF